MSKVDEETMWRGSDALAVFMMTDAELMRLLLLLLKPCNMEVSESN
jgi:hypothetical protein